MCAPFSPDILQAWAVKGVNEQKYDFFIIEPHLEDGSPLSEVKKRDL